MPDVMVTSGAGFDSLRPIEFELRRQTRRGQGPLRAHLSIMMMVGQGHRTCRLFTLAVVVAGASAGLTAGDDNASGHWVSRASEDELQFRRALTNADFSFCYAYQAPSPAPTLIAMPPTPTPTTTPTAPTLAPSTATCSWAPSFTASSCAAASGSCYASNASCAASGGIFHPGSCGSNQCGCCVMPTPAPTTTPTAPDLADDAASDDASLERSYPCDDDDGSDTYLAASFAGTSDKFLWSSAYWTDDTTFDDGSEKKTSAWFVTASEVILEITRADTCNSIRIALETSMTLQEIFLGGQICTCASVCDWRELYEGVGYQWNCNMQGFNMVGECVWADGDYGISAAYRIGWYQNEQADCDSCDSGHGVGGDYFSAGANCNAGGGGECAGEYTDVWAKIYVVADDGFLSDSECECGSETCACDAPVAAFVIGLIALLLHVFVFHAGCAKPRWQDDACACKHFYSSPAIVRDGGAMVTKQVVTTLLLTVVMISTGSVCIATCPKASRYGADGIDYYAFGIAAVVFGCWGFFWCFVILSKLADKNRMPERFQPQGEARIQGIGLTGEVLVALQCDVGHKVSELTRRMCEASEGKLDASKFRIKLSLNRETMLPDHAKLSAVGVAPGTDATVTVFFEELPDFEYEISRESLSWGEHERRAVERGGHLASVHSEEENAEIRALCPSGGLWLGGTRRGGGNGPDAEHWAWSDGTPWDYTRWGRGQPDNAGGNQNRVWMGWPQQHDPTWDDVNEGHRIGAVYKVPRGGGGGGGIEVVRAWYGGPP